jgi:hypothetical protein
MNETYVRYTVSNIHTYNVILLVHSYSNNEPLRVTFASEIVSDLGIL